MHLQTIGILLAGSQFAQAFVIPDGTPEGVYAVTRDVDGAEVHTLISKSRASSSLDEKSAVPKVNVLQKRVQSTYCGCKSTLNHANTDNAVADVKRQLDNGDVAPHSAIYSIKAAAGQQVVAFACNTSKDTYTYGSDVYTAALQAITRNCGAYIAGAELVVVPKGPDEYAFLGYQRYSSGVDFCGNANKSTKSSCP